MALIAGAGLLSAPAAARVLSAPAAQPHASRVLAPRAVAATPAGRCGTEPTTGAAWERLFDSLRGSWAGGDGAASLRLPDGRMLWLFGDTFTGSVRSDGSRGSDSQIVHNSIVVTSGSCARVLPTASAALPGRAGTWLWPTAGVVSTRGAKGRASTITVFAQRVRRTGTGAFDFEQVGTAVATLTVPWSGVPTVGRVRDLPRSRTLWGAGLIADGATTWIYGTRAVHEPWVFGRDLLLARAPTARLADVASWTYRTRTGWTADADDAVVVRPARDGVSTVPSAVRIGTTFVLVTKAQEFLDPTVVALTSTRAWGPWTEAPLFRAAGSGSVLRYSPAVVAGAARARLIVVVSRTSTSLSQLAADVEVARPTFTDVRLR